MRFGLRFFSIGQIIDVSHSTGISSLYYISDISLNISFTRSDPPEFSNSRHTRILSSPAALLFLSELIVIFLNRGIYCYTKLKLKKMRLKISFP